MNVEVNIRPGRVRGIIADGVSTFKGIPYAAPAMALMDQYGDSLTSLASSARTAKVTPITFTAGTNWGFVQESNCCRCVSPNIGVPDEPWVVIVRQVLLLVSKAQLSNSE